MLSNATIRNFLRFLEPFLGVFPAGVRMVVVVANLPPTDSYKRCKKKIRIMIVITKQFFVSLKLEKSIRNNLQGPQRHLDFGKELHRQTWWTWGGGTHGIYKSTSQFQISYKILIKKHYTYFSIWIESSWDCEFNNPIPMPASTLKVCWNRL